MIMMRKIMIDMSCPGAEKPEFMVNFCITISLSPAGGSFLRRAGDENISRISKVFGKLSSLFPLKPP